jgi:hypothetical protein
MNFGTNPYDVAFLALAPVIAVVSLRLTRRMHIAVAVIITALLCWGLGFASEAWVDAQWVALLDRTTNPSPQLMNQFNSDGASKAALVLFGFPIALAYTVVSFGVVRGVRYLLRREIHA